MATAQDGFHEALALHHSGRCDEAEPVYHELLRTDPAHGYDGLLRQTSESWYDDVDDQTANLTYTTAYNDLGQVASIGDGATDYTYSYGLFGNLTSTTQDLPGLTPDVKFAYRYDSSGRLAEVAVFIGPVADYLTTYAKGKRGRTPRRMKCGVWNRNEDTRPHKVEGAMHVVRSQCRAGKYRWRECDLGGAERSTNGTF